MKKGFITYMEMRVEDNCVEYLFDLQKMWQFINYEIRFNRHRRFEDLELLNVGDKFLYYELINMDLLKFSTDIILPKQGIPVNEFSNVKLRVYCKNFCPDIKLGYSLKIKIYVDFEHKTDEILGWNISIKNKNIFLTQQQETLLNENTPSIYSYNNKGLCSYEFRVDNSNTKNFNWKIELDTPNIIEKYYHGIGTYIGTDFKYYTDPEKI